jgi:hypothetical protein
MGLNREIKPNAMRKDVMKKLAVYIYLTSHHQPINLSTHRAAPTQHPPASIFSILFLAPLMANVSTSPHSAGEGKDI